MSRFIIFSILFYCVSIFPKSNTNEIENDFNVFWKNLSSTEVHQLQSEIMQKYLDKSANPCEDFVQYACGNWLKYNPNSDRYTRYTVNHVRNKKLESAIKNFVASSDFDLNDKNEVKTAEEKLKYYYSTCIEEYRQDKTDFNEFLKVFEPYGSAPLWNQNWKSVEFDWKKLAAFGQKIEWPIFIQINFDSNIISWVSYNSFLSSEDWDKYLVYIENVLKLTGIDSETAKQAAREIYDMEEKLSNVERDEYRIRVKENREGKYDYKTMEDLIKDYPEIDWKSYFLDLVDNNEDNLDSSKQFEIQANIKKFIDIIKSTKPENLANFMIWQNLRRSIRSFDSRYRNAYKKFREGYFIGLDYGTEKRCYDDINNYFRAHSALYYANYFEIDEEFLDKIIEDLREALINDFKNLKWLEDDIKNDVIDDYLKKFKIQITRPQPTSVEKINELFADLKITPKKSFENFFNLIYFKNKVRLADKLSNPFTFRNSFNQETNILPIQDDHFFPSNYNKHFPDALNFGGLGTSLAENIMSHIPFMDTFSPESFVDDKASDLVSCYKKIYELKDLSSYKVYLQNSAIEKSFKIYQKWSSQNSKDAKLPGFDATPEQLFFINYAQNQCVSENEDLAQTDDVMLALANHKAFADAFSCPIGSKMNPETKCENIF